MDPMRFMQEGGFGMWILLALAILHLPVGPLALLLRNRMLAFVGIALEALTLGVMVAFYVVAMNHVEMAVANAEPAVRDEMRRVGEGEADNLLWFGIPAALIPGAMSAAALVFASRQRSG